MRHVTGALDRFHTNLLKCSSRDWVRKVNVTGNPFRLPWLGLTTTWEHERCMRSAIRFALGLLRYRVNKSGQLTLKETMPCFLCGEGASSPGHIWGGCHALSRTGGADQISETDIHVVSWTSNPKHPRFRIVCMFLHEIETAVEKKIHTKNPRTR